MAAGLMHTALFATVCAAVYGYHRVSCFREAFTARRTQPSSKKRLVVISGCDRGFGKLLAEKLYQDEKFIVLGLTLTKEGSQALEEKYATSHKEKQSTGLLYAIPCDVTNDVDVAKAKERAEELLQEHQAALYSIVNNAGIAISGDCLFFDKIDNFERVMNVNYLGQVRLTQQLLPLMLRTSRVCGGRIVNLSSVCGAVASPSNSIYNASKFAVEAWSDSLRVELKSFNIDVVKVRPGQINTAIQKDWTDQYLRGFENAPASIRELYGGKEFVTKVKTLFDSMTVATPPEIVVDSLVDILDLPSHKLKASYWVGLDAWTLFRAMATLPTAAVDRIKHSLLHLTPILPPTPPVGMISHLTIHVKSLEKSIPFYESFGYERFGEKVDDQQFLVVQGAKGDWPTRILLKEVPGMSPRAPFTDAGMTRLCLLSLDAEADFQELASKGIQPMGPIARHASETLAAFQDPDGFVVYIVQFHGVLGAFLRLRLWWSQGNLRKVPFHWTVHVTDLEHGKKVFHEIGFDKVMFDGKEQKDIKYNLVPPFNLSETSSRLVGFNMRLQPKDTLVTTLASWQVPETKVGPSSLSSSMTISVNDVEKALERAQAAGMVVKEAPEYRALPGFGKVLVGTAYLEEGSGPIEFCCFQQVKV